MCAASPGARVSHPSQSSIKTRELDGEHTLQALSTLLNVVHTSYGPMGRLKALHNNSGGHVTLTSCAARMFSALSISNPVLKLIIPVVEKHLNVHGDGGLFCAMLSLKIIMSSLNLDLHRHLITEILDLISADCMEYLSGKVCACVVDFDANPIKDLMCLTKSVIRSKPGCCLRDADLNHIQSLMLDAFLKTMDPVQANKIQYLCVEGLPPCDSHLVGGVLFETPHIPTYMTQPVMVKREDSGPRKGMVKVALFNISMAGDSAEFVSGDYEMEGEISLVHTVLDQMKVCVEAMVHAEVGIVGCQRVIHPEVKKCLRDHGVLVLDRLGSRYIHALHNITGCRMLGTFLQVPEDSCYGWLSSVEHVVMSSRSFLHLNHAESTVVTVVLGHRSEEALEELKAACVSSQHVLQRALMKSRALVGGGCWQTHLAHHISTQVMVHCKEWSANLECSPHQLKTVANTVVSALEYVAKTIGPPGEDHMTDPTNHHLWRIISPGVTTSTQTCSCGMFYGCPDRLGLLYVGIETEVDSCIAESTAACCDTGSLEVLDPYDCCVNGFRVALATASMVLGIHNIVEGPV